MEQQPRHIFLTGPPRIGKTTIVLKVAEELRDMGLKVGGMISQETREGGVRVGFKIVDLETGVEGVLAHINRRSGPPVGKYRVCLEDLENVGVKAILNACKGSDLIVIDEVGPMELHSEAFRKAVLEALNSGKTALGTIHCRASSPFIDAIRKRRDIKIIEVTYGNRDGLSKTIAKEIFRRVSKY